MGHLLLLLDGTDGTDGTPNTTYSYLMKNSAEAALLLVTDAEIFKKKIKQSRTVSINSAVAVVVVVVVVGVVVVVVVVVVIVVVVPL